MENKHLEEIVVSYNPLRLLGDTFLHIQPEKEGVLSLRGVYRIAHEQYGALGLAQVVTTDQVALNELRAAEMMLTIGSVGMISRYREKGYKFLDKFGIYALRFTIRNEAFSDLIIKETKRAGIPLVMQQSMF